MGPLMQEVTAYLLNAWNPKTKPNKQSSGQPKSRNREQTVGRQRGGWGVMGKMGDGEWEGGTGFRV